MSRRHCLLLLPLLLLAACGEPEDTRPGQPVAHRRAAFKAILEVFEPMGQMLRDGNVDPQLFQSLAKQLVAKREAPWQWFGADTLYPPSRAKAEVWSQADKFDEEKRAFYAASDRLLQAAGQTDKQRLQEAFDAVNNTCKSCHKSFKSR